MKLHISISLVRLKGKGNAKKNCLHCCKCKAHGQYSDSAALDKHLSWHSPGCRTHFYDANYFPLPTPKNMPLYQIQEASAKLLSSFFYHVLNQKPPSDREFQRANTALNVLVRGQL